MLYESCGIGVPLVHYAPHGAGITGHACYVHGEVSR